MTPATVYYSPFCPFCVMALRLLKQRGVSPEKIRVDNDPARKLEMIERAGRSTVPQIFIGPVHVGGCDDLYALDNDGKLEQLIHESEIFEGAADENDP